MNATPDTTVHPTAHTSEQQTARDILTDMTRRYRAAQAELEDTRLGLIEAVKDGKIHGLKPAELMEITGWSRAQVAAVTRPTSRATAVQTTGQAGVQSTSADVQSTDTAVQSTDTAVQELDTGVQSGGQDVQAVNT